MSSYIYIYIHIEINAGSIGMCRDHVGLWICIYIYIYHPIMIPHVQPLIPKTPTSSSIKDLHYITLCHKRNIAKDWGLRVVHIMGRGL